VRREQGSAHWYDENGKETAACSTFTCAHCNTVVFVRPKTHVFHSAPGFCQLCSAHTCRKCTSKECKPFEKKLEEIERRGRFMKAVLP
jgi:hypothetical protein